MIQQKSQKQKYKRGKNTPFFLLLVISVLLATTLWFIRSCNWQKITVQSIIKTGVLQNAIIQIIRYSSFLERVNNKIVQLEKTTSADIIAEPNFADIYGGAMILTKNAEARNVRNLLMGDDDKYMYIERKFPIYFVIGLKEEIATSKISIKSRQMYSSIVKHFTVQGSFTFPTNNWTHLGSFRGKNTFSEQSFNLSKNVVRYIKVTITSTYGSWMYFTLTQVKVFGDGIFADAIKEKATPPSPKKLKTQPSKGLVKHNFNFIEEALKQTLTSPQKVINFCPNNIQSNFFQREQLQKQNHQNIIVNLLSKIERLQSLNQESLSRYLEIQQRFYQVQLNLSYMKRKQSLIETESMYKLNKMQEKIDEFTSNKALMSNILMISIVFLIFGILILHVFATNKTPEAKPIELKSPFRRQTSIKSCHVMKESPT